ncbi:hypothetical protein BHE74_00014848 [Ensete ventricosum]|nr:hypothetical protein GW17_00044680 [Ensete ventricosum]RWW77009.1 hypothetical protein BHE74_00014848 [Ensete ventricosum]
MFCTQNCGKPAQDLWLLSLVKEKGFITFLKVIWSRGTGEEKRARGIFLPLLLPLLLFLLLSPLIDCQWPKLTVDSRFRWYRPVVGGSCTDQLANRYIPPGMGPYCSVRQSLVGSLFFTMGIGTTSYSYSKHSTSAEEQADTTIGFARYNIRYYLSLWYRLLHLFGFQSFSTR